MAKETVYEGGVDHSGKTAFSGNLVAFAYSHTDWDDETGASETYTVTTTEDAYFVGHHIDVAEQISFEGSDTTGATVQVGVSGNTDKYVGATTITSLEAGAAATASGDDETGVLIPAGTELLMTFTGTGGGSEDLDDADAGAGTVYLRLDPVS